MENKLSRISFTTVVLVEVSASFQHAKGDQKTLCTHQ